MNIIIVSPSLESTQNVSGVSSVTNFIISNNSSASYRHFLQGRSDGESSAAMRIKRLVRSYKKWDGQLRTAGDAIIHYNFPLDAFSIVRDYFFMNKAHKMRRRMVIHLHGGLYLFREHKPFIMKWMLKKIFSWDYPFIVLSNKEKEQIEKEYHSQRVFVLPNCIDLSSASSFFRKDFPQRLNILYLGRIEPNKGIDYICDAASRLQDAGIDFMLHFAGKEQGSNHYVDRLRELLGERFVYEGVVSGKDKDELLKLCDVFLLPSFYEGLPMSLLECMSFGMVPVATDVGSIRDFVEQGETGLFVKVKDVESIVNAIKTLYADPSLRKHLSEGAREKIFSVLSPHEYISKLNSIYQVC